LGDDCRQSVDLMETVGAECNPAFVRHVPVRLRHTDELGSPVTPRRFIRQPAVDPGLARESKRRQKHFIERPYFGEIAHSEIDVIETTPHGYTRLSKECNLVS
jgi:hypothetical protein